MTMFERTREARHVVGPNGSVILHTIAARVVVRGVDGDEARVVLRYALRSPDDEAAQRIEDTFDARTLRSEGRLEVSSGEGRRIAIDAGPFAAIARAFGITLDEGMQLEAEIPRGATLRVDSMSGSIEAAGLTGRQGYRTVSGAMRVGSSGEVTAETVSGDVEVDAPAELTLDWHSVSGSLRARSSMFRLARLDTMSGDALLAGPLHPDGGHRAHSVSGSLRIEAHGGLTIETKSLSGAIRSEVEHRLEGAPGRVVLVTGDGRTRLRFDTVSGTATVLRRPSDTAAGPVGKSAPSAPSAPASPAVPGIPVAGAAGRAPAPAPDPVPAAWASPASPNGSQGPTDRLEVLRAVERGDIDVDEAVRLLAEPSDA